ncbi:S1C family serine protease [Marinibactrum halimedae]|uniref:S1C family serine protease n=1 Tax=Marinibactrum halimedae TaxID=1444977 RepID=UPI001E518642
MSLSPLTLAASNDAKSLHRLKQAVIKIYTSQAAPDYFTPWRLLNIDQTSGSGVVIDGQRILTNAHVIADARYLQVQKHGDPKKYLAKVAFVSHEADLAMLTVDEGEFFEGLNALKFGKLPDPLTEVSVFGYPFGGQSLSITKGILSRVEHQLYAHAGSFLLAGQIDAAINPGNSGGPVIVGNKIVGIVMQANAGGRAENLGYFVPPSVISHFLEDAQDGVFDGTPDIGFRTQSLESPAAKRAHGLSDDESGALVTKVFEDSANFGVVLVNDILVNIDGYDIADDQTIALTDDLRTNFKFAVDHHQPGESLPITVVRRGERITLSVRAEPVVKSRTLVQGIQYDEVPRYLVYGGVVFVPLNMNLIKRWGRDWHSKAPVDFLQARNKWSGPQRREAVVALKVLAADVNLGYHDWKNWVVESLNDEPIVDFTSFAANLLAYDGEYVQLEDDQGYKMVIDHQDALSQERAIRDIYGLPNSFSKGLLDTVARLKGDQVVQRFRSHLGAPVITTSAVAEPNDAGAH